MKPVLSALAAPVSAAVIAAVIATVVAAGAVAEAKETYLTRVPEPSVNAPSPSKKAVAPSALVSSGAPAKVQTSQKDVAVKHFAALARAAAGDNKGALAALTALSQSASGGDELDRVYLSIGRIQYELGNNQAALDAYQRVRKGSVSWLESLEERAWAQMRMGHPEETLASMKTVLAPIFREKISSEPYFLTSLAQLRVCDYTSMFKTVDLFKKRFRDKIKGWESSSTDASAQTQLKEAGDTIQKMNLVEAEAIQRIYMDESGKRQQGSAPKIARGRDQLSFPEVDGDEIWLDEVDSYRVSVKGCPKPPAMPATAPANLLAKKEKAL